MEKIDLSQMRHDVIENTIRTDNFIKDIIRTSFGLELDYLPNGEVNNEEEIKRFNKFFLEEIGWLTKLRLIKEIANDIDENTKIPNKFEEKFEEYYKIRVHFSNLDLITNNIKTCSFTPVLKWFCHKDMDHIMVKGFKKIGTGTFQGFSDHKLLYADLK